MIRFSCIILASMLISIANAASIADRFDDPPHEYSLVPLWSWNSSLDPQQLRWQLDQMVEKGVYGAFMHARGGIESSDTPYFSDGWWKAVETCVEHGADIGFRTWIYDEDKWPSGAAGGRTLARNPQRNCQKILRLHSERVQGPADVTLGVSECGQIVAGRLAAEGELDPESLVDLTATEATVWKCPPGEWVVYRYTFEPFGDGVNYMNADTVRDFIEITHEEYARRFGAHLGSTIPGVFFDEIMNEAGKSEGCIVWAEDFAERFRAMKHYDLAPFLPALHFDIGPETPKIRCDYYDVYTSLYEEAWFQQIAEWCEAHSVELTGHTVEDLNRYITQGDYMRTMRRLQIPLTDNEDFRYTWPRTIGSWKPKQAASITHLYGQSRAGAEALGGAGWVFTPDMARYGINTLAAYGVSFFVPHLFHYAQDTPASMDDWPNSWFYQNPYWKYFKILADHARRVSFVLGEGQPVVDVAVLYPQTNQWAGYGPGTTQKTVDVLTADLLDVDVIDPPSLARATIGDGALHVCNMSYHVLILPALQCMRKEETDKVLAFLNAGGRVIAHDRWPSDSMEEGRDDPRMKDFQTEAEANGAILTNVDETSSVIATMLDRDLILVDGQPGTLRYMHLRDETTDIYWLTNTGSQSGTWRISFRAQGRPSVWNPEDGSIAPLTDVVRDDARTVCEVSLDRWQGNFLAFDASGVPETTTAPLGTEWTYSSGGSKDLDGAIALDGFWDFLAVGHALDDVWSDSPAPAMIEIPVMRVRWERKNDNHPDWAVPEYDDSHWRQVKVRDALHPEAGAGRYRTRWDGRFISWNNVAEFDLERFYQPKIGGAGLKCRKQFVLPPHVAGGRLNVVCESPYRVDVNGVICAQGQGGGNAEEVALTSVRAGENTLTILANDSQAILAEAVFHDEHGGELTFATDRTWETSIDGEEWLPAYEYVGPPEPPYGEPSHPSRADLPNTVWYRQGLPPGVDTIYEPVIKGSWTAWVDGQPLLFQQGQASAIPGKYPSTIAIRVQLDEHEHGLLEPLRIRCVPASQPLVSWTSQNLEWYSGRCLYSREFSLDEHYAAADTRVELDLGRVGHCAEIWINGTLAGTRIWPPYRVDVTPYVRPGENRVTVVVTNLIANQMRWDIFDDARADLQSRKWHDDNILRDAWCLDSGLMGPVRLVPMRTVASEARPVIENDSAS